MTILRILPARSPRRSPRRSPKYSVPGLLLTVGVGVLFAGCGDDSSAPADTAALPEPTGALVFSVPDVPEGGTVPVEYTCDGSNQVPVVEIGRVPAEATELALIVDDPDAPRDDPYVHWIVYRIPAESGQVSDGLASLSYGETDGGTTSWFGPCPPGGDDPHGYRWRLFALGEPIEVDEGVDGRELEAALDGTVVDTAEWVAFYGRE